MNRYELQTTNTEECQAEIQNTSLIWGAKFYSPILGEFLWIVLRYPYNLDDEQSYLRVKNTLRLRRRGKTSKWKIRLDPFVPSDGRRCLILRNRTPQQLMEIHTAKLTYPGQRIIQEGPEKREERFLSRERPKGANVVYGFPKFLLNISWEKI